MPPFAERLLACAAALGRGARAGYLMRRAASSEDWAAVRALRRAALASHGDIAPAAGDWEGDRHDAAPGTRTFLLLKDGRPVGSTRASCTTPAAPQRLPAMDAFERDLAPMAEAGAVVEAGLTVVDPDAPDPMAAAFHLFKAHMLACASCEAAWLVAAVRETRIGFYRRVLGMEILGGAEKVPGLALPRVLMGLRFRERAPDLAKRIPLLSFTERDERRYAARGEVAFEAGRSAVPAREPRGGPVAIHRA